VTLPLFAKLPTDPLPAEFSVIVNGKAFKVRGILYEKILRKEASNSGLDCNDL
jgi:hypothetical protein